MKEAGGLHDDFQKGLRCHRAGQLRDAERIYRDVLKQQPQHVDALHLLGAIHLQHGDLAEAIRLMSAALEADPRSVPALYNRAIAFHNTGRYEDALSGFEQAIALGPHYADAFSNRGKTLLQLGRFHNALESCDNAIALDSGHAQAFNNRGLALVALDRHKEALASYNRSIELNDRNSDAYSNRGVVLRELWRLEDALVDFDRSIALCSDDAVSHSNRGLALEDLGRYEEALASFATAIALKPDHASAHWNEGLCRLTLGDFERGWQKYEWRHKLKDAPPLQRSLERPLWLGDEDIGGRTILLQAEQGFGDTIQFCRYATLVARQSAAVILEVHPALKTLMATLSGPSRVVGTGEMPPSFDYYCPLLSLPRAFRATLDGIPAATPYLSSTPKHIDAWSDRLGRKRGLRIGLAWSGARTHRKDRERSIPLALLEPLVSIGAEFISLQNETRDSDAGCRCFARIREFSEALTDFAETAALTSLMDIVISVDTSIAHLAGALGRPVWILLPYVPDWRWLLNRQDSPWYPTARLFRQSQAGDWSSVIQSVVDAVSNAKT